jgi:hypothetical protein
MAVRMLGIETCDGLGISVRSSQVEALFVGLGWVPLTRHLVGGTRPCPVRRLVSRFARLQFA